jgi:cytoplasmic iron level regulating protein YaaA (DUF328/UPF0246 family)
MPGIIILLHSSKTMRLSKNTHSLRSPALINQARKLSDYLKTLDDIQISKYMHMSSELASKTKNLINSWNFESQTNLAVDSFVGDIYSGLRAGELSTSDRDYADSVLWILSGLYGFIRPLDTIALYRLEMGYKFPHFTYSNLYSFWGELIAKQLPDTGIIVNASSLEYSKVILPFVEESRVFTPVFLTINPKTGMPTFTAVHAKIARGAFARWLIVNRIRDTSRFKEFNDLGYVFNPSLSKDNTPTFVCQTFLGIGLSIRLT